MKPASKRAKAITATSGHAMSRLAEDASSNRASGERPIGKLGAGEVRTVRFPIKNRLQRPLLESKRLALTQATDSGSSRMYLSLVELSNIDEI